MNVSFALVCASVLVASALLVAGALLLDDAACPSLTAASGAHWMRPYHAGENPWTDAWALPDASPPASRVAAADGRRHAAADRSASTDACLSGGTGAAPKSSSSS